MRGAIIQGMDKNFEEVGVYIHWPFCISKCNYCNFNSYVQEVPAGFLEQYLRQMVFFKDYLGMKSLRTIYFGGGTPSLMAPECIRKIIEKVTEYAGLVQDSLEITLEANPETVDAKKLKSIRDAGVNRISLGIQSFKDNWLQMMGRKNNRQKNIDTIAAVDGIFENYSIDLIYSLPNQTTWETELREALELAGNAKHFSLYELSLEKGTVFDHRYSEADYTDYIDLTHKIMLERGFDHYEISNYAKNGARSKHNMLYWEYKDYIGIGAGAHGRITLDGVKYSFEGERNLKKWSESDLKFIPLSPYEEEIERLIMGFRTDLWCKINGDVMDTSNVEEFVGAGFLERNQKNEIRTTFEGKKRLNAILEAIIKDEVVATS